MSTIHLYSSSPTDVCLFRKCNPKNCRIVKAYFEKLDGDKFLNICNVLELNPKALTELLRAFFPTKSEFKKFCLSLPASKKLEIKNVLIKSGLLKIPCKKPVEQT